MMIDPVVASTGTGYLMIAATPRRQVRPPTLKLMPATTVSGIGLFLSALAHTAAVAGVVMWLRVLSPVEPMTVRHQANDLLRERDYDVFVVPILPTMERESASDGVKDGLNFAGADFAGPRAIVSNWPDATNSVQTIRRPDLVAPPKLMSPVRLQTMVTLPAPPVSVSPAPQLEPQVPPSAEKLPMLPASERGAQLLARSWADSLAGGFRRAGRAERDSD